MVLSKKHGQSIYDVVKKRKLRYFKYYHVKHDTGLRIGQFRLGVCWLLDKGLIERSGGDSSAWRMI